MFHTPGEYWEAVGESSNVASRERRIYFFRQYSTRRHNFERLLLVWGNSWGTLMSRFLIIFAEEFVSDPNRVAYEARCFRLGTVPMAMQLVFA
jgi:hypothetical protein